jgi:hypothetical protein
VPLAIILSHVSHSPTECSCSSKSDAAKLLSAVTLLFSSTCPIKSRHGCPCRALHFSHYYRSLLGSHVHQFWSPSAHTSSAPMAHAVPVPPALTNKCHADWLATHLKPQVAAARSDDHHLKLPDSRRAAKKTFSSRLWPQRQRQMTHHPAVATELGEAPFAHNCRWIFGSNSL